MSDGKSLSHSASITSITRGYFIFLIDQSGSMSDSFWNEQGGTTLAQATARMINNWIEEMILEAAKGGGVTKDYFDISVVGYRTDANANPIVGSALSGGLSGKERVTIIELETTIPFTENVEQKLYNAETGEVELQSTEKPCWIAPIADGGTPFSAALLEAHRLASEWIASQDQTKKRFPPIVINITDAEYDEDDGNEYSPEQYAASLTDLATNDGNVLLFTCQLCREQSDPIVCPNSLEQLPADNFARMMYQMSSELPKTMLPHAQQFFPDLAPGARCLAYNIDDTSKMVHFFKIGTLVSLR